MARDNLRELLDLARREVPGIPPSALTQLEMLVRRHYGGQPFYVAKRNGTAIEAAVEADLLMSAVDLAVKLNVTVRHARRVLKRRKP